MEKVSSTNSQTIPLSRIIMNVMLGTGGGIAVRYLGMPIEAVLVQRSFPECTKSHLQLFRENVFNWKKFRYLQTVIFSKTCLRQSAYKTLSNNGVVTLVETSKPSLGSFEKWAIIASLSAVLETITTTPGEWNKTLALDEINKKKVPMFNAFRFASLSDRNYHRCLRATFIRSSWSGIFTYGGVYGLESLIKPYYPEEKDSAKVKVFSGTVGPMLMQFIIMPGVNLQTYVFRNPELPWRTSIKQCLADYKVNKITDIYKLSKAFELRAWHRGFLYGLNYLFTEMLKKS